MDEPSLDVRRLDELRRSNAQLTILDVREPWETEICALEGSLHIPVEELPDRIDAIPEEGTLVVVCHLGIRSQQVAEWLRGYGYENAVNLEGGLDAWARQVDPSMAVY